MHRFRTVSPIDQLVFVTSFCTEEGEIVRHPFAPAWPAHMLTTVTFEETAPGTMVTVLWEPLEPSEEEAAFFTEILPSCHEGRTGTFDRLEQVLKEATAIRG